MRNLIFVFLFTLTGSYANNFSNDELKSSSVEPVPSFEKSTNGIYDFDGFDLGSLSKDLIINSISMKIEQGENSCTVSISATINLAGNGVEIKVSATASSCEEAVAEAISGAKATIKAVKQLLKAEE